MRVISRLLFVVFFALGGFLFYIPKWILFGTKASRERREILKLQRRQVKLAERQARSV